MIPARGPQTLFEVILGKSAATANPGLQAIGSWARQVQASLCKPKRAKVEFCMSFSCIFSTEKLTARACHGPRVAESRARGQMQSRPRANHAGYRNSEQHVHVENERFASTKREFAKKEWGPVRLAKHPPIRK